MSSRTSGDSGPYIRKPRSDTPRPERRSVPRYPADTQLFASIDSQTVCLRNISEQGVAMHATGLQAGSVHLLEINLHRQHVSVPVEILDCSDAQLTHARLIGLSARARDLIGHFIRDFARPAGTLRTMR